MLLVSASNAIALPSYGIDDIRYLYQNDARFLGQFA